ncbi:hypothetical protein L1987_32642 [Smallanthus sonchifolius]|uniref:Uncharacterized protein n=1 Tax=Smallanthus sonchifolius TaxID=185202 RepID=A0ACB9HQ19_9ASTR|nr:hypothetical protein L1987_32642 [Smallanthus sonchifolius]
MSRLKYHNAFWGLMLVDERRTPHFHPGNQKQIRVLLQGKADNIVGTRGRMFQSPYSDTHAVEPTPPAFLLSYRLLGGTSPAMTHVYMYTVYHIFYSTYP